MIIKPQPRQETALASPADIILTGGGAGGGKCNRLSGHTWLMHNISEYSDISQYSDYKHLIPEEVMKLDGQVLHSNGKFCSIADINAGDEIINPDGSFQRVKSAHDNGELDFYRVSFEDGTFVDCSHDHLWGGWVSRKQKHPKLNKGFSKQVHDNITSIGWNFNYIRAATKVFTTKEIFDEMNSGKRIIIPINAPLRFKSPPKPVDKFAYTLGFWIGDGHTIGNRHKVSTTDDHVLERIEAVADVTGVLEEKNRKTPMYSVTIHSDEFDDLLMYSGLSGKLQHDRFIPDRWLKKSYNVRLELARGLFDADGYASGSVKNEVSYCTTSPRLADDIAYLVRSLGYMAKIRKKQGVAYNNGKAKAGRMAYIVTVEGNDRWRLFSLPKKIQNAINHEPRIYVGKAVTSVEYIGKHYGRCISVDNPNRLYITDDFNVTHNTFGILMSPLRWLLTTDNFYGVIFRRTTPQITAPSGLWHAAIKLYGNFPQLRMIPSKREVVNDSNGSVLAFRHLEKELDVLNWQGTELNFIGLDEATHFTEYQFTYLQSRLRSTGKVSPYMLMTCNPDAESWLLKYVEWYLSQDGTPDPSKSDTIRHFERDGDGNILWLDKPTDDSKSFVFIPSSIQDNQALMKADPDYLKNLKALPLVERMRLLDQNWHIQADSGMYLNREWWRYIDKPPQALRMVRYWDRAATLPKNKRGQASDPDYTVGLLAGEYAGKIYVLDVCRFRGTPAMVEAEISRVTAKDGRMVTPILEQDPGQAGKTEIDMYRRMIPEAGFEANRVRVSKQERVWTASRMLESGDIYLVGNQSWQKEFIDECHNFGSGKGHDDQVDALSGAVNELVSGNRVFASASGVSRIRQTNKMY